MHQDNEKKQFHLTEDEQRLIPEAPEVCGFDESTILIDLINNAISRFSDPTALSDFPHGSQREARRQQLSAGLEILTAARMQALPVAEEYGLPTEDDFRRLLQDDDF